MNECNGHCHCIGVGYSETHTRSGPPEKDANGKIKSNRQVISDINDAMCCFCGHFRDGKLRFVQAPGHGLLRHHTAKPASEWRKV